MKKLFLLLALSTPFLAACQNSDFLALDQIISQYEKKSKTMGSIAFCEGGVVTYSRAWGFSSLKQDKPADVMTLYRIGSISKLLCSTLILQLVAEDKLSLDTPIAQFFPSLPGSDRITIEHLLRHQSGLHNFNKSKVYKGAKDSPESKEETIVLIAGSPIDFAPGTQTDYNNTNYVVLSLLVAEIDGRAFSESLFERIIKPLKLLHTHAGGYIDPAGNEAHSYYWKRKWRQNEDLYNKSLSGAGALVSTPRDLNRFLWALFNGDLIPESQLSAMLDIQDGMGLGLFAFPFYSLTAYGHAGNIDSFESFAVYFPEKKVCVSIFLNANRVDFNQLLIEFLEAYFND